MRNSFIPMRSGVWLGRLRVMTVKELLQLSRDAILLIFILYSFTGDVYLAGTGAGLELKNALMAAVDGDQSFYSRELLSRFRQPYFNFRGEVGHPGEGMRLLDEGKVMLVLDIPPGFQKTILKGQQAEVQMQIDTSNTALGTLASSYAAQIVGQYGQELAFERMGLSDDHETLPVVIGDHRVWFNPNLKESWFMPISEMLQMITLFSILLPAAAMAREKERGTVEQLLVSPLTPFQIMFPKVLAMTLVILAGMALSLFAVLDPFFNVPMKGSLILFFAITTIYVFTNAGIGLFVATIGRNLAQVSMLTLLIFAPMLFLSGTWTPPEAMPVWLRAIVLISPLHYYMDVTYGILLKGAGIDILWDSVLIMAFLGVVVFGFGMWRFKRQFD